MSAILISKIDTVIYSIAKTLELAVQYGDESLKNKKIYEVIIFEIAKVLSGAKAIDDQVKNLKDLETVDAFEQKYKEMKENSKINVKASNHYKDWMNKITTIIGVVSVSSNNDSRLCDEDFEMISHISDIDPITKKRMENPVKNKICGHHYEKDSILKSILASSRFRCPIVGCSNRDFIKQNNLEEDLDFKLKLRRMKNATH